MILTTHAITGAAVAQFFPNKPVLAFLTGFISHFVLDALPHWDYKLSSLKEFQTGFLNKNKDGGGKMVLSKEFGFDVIKVGCDFCLGVIISLFIFVQADTSVIWSTLAGTLGGTLPDPLAFISWLIKKRPKDPLRRLHSGVHSRNEYLDSRPFLGLMTQLILALIIVLFVRYLT